MELNLAEELLLLALDTDTGELILPVTTSIPYGISGAILLELFNRNKITLEDNLIKVKNSDELDDKILNEVLKLISKEKENKDLKFWVKKIIIEFPDLIEKVINNLVDKSILKKEEKKILWLIPVETYPIKDPLPTVNTRLRIRQIVLEDTQPNGKDLALLSLIKATNLIDELFLKDERKQAENIINDLIKNEQIGKVIKDINIEITSVIASTVAGSVAAASVVGNY